MCGAGLSTPPHTNPEEGTDKAVTRNAPASTDKPRATAAGQPPWLIGIIGWQAVVAIGAIALATGFATGAILDLTGVGLVVAVLAAALVAVAAVYAIPYLVAHTNRGRSAATLLQYTLMIVTAVAALQVMGIFRRCRRPGDELPRVVVLGIDHPCRMGDLLAGRPFRLRGIHDRSASASGLTIAGLAILALGTGPHTGSCRILSQARRTRRARSRSIRHHCAVSPSGCSVDATPPNSSAPPPMKRKPFDGYLFVSPNVFGFLGVLRVPAPVLAVRLVHGMGRPHRINWLGFDNYIEIFSIQFVSLDTGQAASDALSAGYSQAFRFGDIVMGARDPNFWIGFRNILFFAVIAIPLATFPALFLAGASQLEDPGMKVFRAHVLHSVRRRPPRASCSSGSSSTTHPSASSTTASSACSI